MTADYDATIIGAGAAGMSAAIYTQRKKLKTLVVSVDVGGQTNLTNHIENYPGYFTDTPGYPSGPMLMKIFQQQMLAVGAKIVSGKVATLERHGDGTDARFTVTLTSGTVYRSRVIILAYGKVPKELGIPGERKFIGNGVSNSTLFDAEKFKGMPVAVIGGGNSGLEGALLCAQYANKVYLVHRRDEFRGDPVTADKVRANDKIELVLSYVPVEVKGNAAVEHLVVENVNDHSKRELAVNGIFVNVGYVVDTEFVKDFVERNDQKEIIVDDHCVTKTPGLFAAGDITSVPYKQTVVSAGMGATAALEAYNYLQRLEGKPTSKADWGV